MRLDVYLSSRGFAKSRTRAQELISGGFVTVDGFVALKASLDVNDENEVSITGQPHEFVGRGGVKLESALDAFGINQTGLLCADIGASTGGFTDCLLKHGAKRVYSVDSGRGQLDPKLLNDERVVNLEGVNARYLGDGIISEKCDLAVIDLSFISQTLVLGAVAGIIRDGGKIISLIKPQFECGRSALNKNGVVKDKKQHLLAVRRVVEFAKSIGLCPTGVIRSPIKGGDGNTEFLLCMTLGDGQAITDNDLKTVVME